MGDILKDKLSNENFKTPECVIQRIDETLENLPERKNKIKLKYAAVAAGVAIVITASIGMANPSFAQSIPLLNSVFKYLHEKNQLGEEYVKFAKGINKSVTDKGLTVTINEVVCDENSINISYTIKNEKKFENNKLPNIYMAFSKINGEELNVGGGESGEFIDEYTYAGVEKLNVGREKIPKSFNFDYNIQNINNIKGNWNFKFVISREDTEELTKNFKVNYKKELNGQEVTIEKVSFTPINTTLIVTSNKSDKEIKGNNGAMKFERWLLFDDKGRQIRDKSSGGSVSSTGFNYEMHYEALNEIPKYLTVIPMNFKQVKLVERVVKSLDNNLPLKVSQGRIGCINIKSVEFLEDKTVVSYDVEGIAPLEQARNVFIVDEDGTEIWSKEGQKAKYSDSNNYNMIFKALDKNKKYKIGTLNFDSYYDVRDDLKFTIPIQK